MAISIDHDISVVSILDLQDITSHRIRCHGLDEVETSLLESRSVHAAIFVDKVPIQIVDLRSAHLVTRCSVGHNIDHSALCSCSDPRQVSCNPADSSHVCHDLLREL
jgi:hypothetical protein